MTYQPYIKLSVGGPCTIRAVMESDSDAIMGYDPQLNQLDSLDNQQPIKLTKSGDYRFVIGLNYWGL